MKLLSIIVPAYNVSKYIEECLNSLVKDSSILDSIEVIVINDGSKDDTLSKCLSCREKYPQSVRIIDKENGGHGSGINIGVEQAGGIYLKVLDSDDWVNNQSLTKLVKYIQTLTESPDIIISDYEQIWTKDNRVTPHFLDRIIPKTIYELAVLNQNNYRFTIHSLTIKTEIYKRVIKERKIDEKTSYDDVQYVLYPVPFINTLVYFNETIYKYRMGDAGQSVNLQNMQKNREKLKKILVNAWAYYVSHEANMNHDQREYYLRDLGFSVGDYLNLLFLLDDWKMAKQEFINFVDIVPIPSQYIVNKKAKMMIRSKWIFFKFVSRWYRKTKTID